MFCQWYESVICLMQLIFAITYVYLTPTNAYTTTTEKRPSFTMVVCTHWVILLTIFRGESPEYALATCILSLLLIYKNTSVMLTSTFNLVISFASNSITSLFILLESVSLFSVLLPIRYLKKKGPSNISRRLLNQYLLNYMTFIFLISILVYSINKCGTIEHAIISANTKTLLSLYLIIKFCSITFNALKDPIYNLLPLQMVALLTIIQLLILPIVLVSGVVFKQTLAGLTIVIILANIMGSYKLLYIKSSKDLMLHTTVISCLLIILTYLT